MQGIGLYNSISYLRFRNVLKVLSNDLCKLKEDNPTTISIYNATNSYINLTFYLDLTTIIMNVIIVCIKIGIFLFADDS